MPTTPPATKVVADAKERLQGKVVVVTGATSGFGKGAAMAFAHCGASVVVAARREELLDELVGEFEATGHAALAVVTDVSKAADVERLAAAAIQRFGRIDVWVNNAGVGAIGPFEDIPIEDHVQVIATDLFGALYGSHAAYRQFIAQGEGVLINIGSELSKTSVPYYTSYTAAKHGILGLSTSLRQEVMQNEKLRGRVHVCVVMPTAHDTPFFDHVANYTGHEIAAPPPLHAPAEVVLAIVSLAHDPQDEVVVGTDGHFKMFEQAVMPGIFSKMAAKQMHKVQMVDAPLGPQDPGAVQHPNEKGAGVSGGRKAREKEQKQQTKEHH